ncbi:hypothetical protein [Streptomyces sp. t39]|uniref:hypothetical protein n=1 Tax=Streptomyces sp. t39 TaxID=1828156 RepID=UPI0011CE14B9|nr:hypothetical protein [Streptomyces sp. t39]TXS35308.1 hypothetical protein EAO77_37090 [Streptomyces sp. t39]
MTATRELRLLDPNGYTVNVVTVTPGTEDDVRDTLLTITAVAHAAQWTEYDARDYTVTPPKAA